MLVECTGRQCAAWTTRRCAAVQCLLPTESRNCTQANSTSRLTTGLRRDLAMPSTHLGLLVGEYISQAVAQQDGCHRHWAHSLRGEQNAHGGTRVAWRNTLLEQHAFANTQAKHRERHPRAAAHQLPRRAQQRVCYAWHKGAIQSVLCSGTKSKPVHMSARLLHMQGWDAALQLWQSTQTGTCICRAQLLCGPPC